MVAPSKIAGPNGLPGGAVLAFKLGDVVLCRYSSYPYWPATVDQTHQKGFKGRFWAMLRTKSGESVLCFWCTFANEDTGGWVRADRMVLFHPALLSKIRVSKDSEWHADQKEAIESAMKSFREMHKDNDVQVPKLPTDLEHGKHAGKWDAVDDDDIISDEESHPGLVDDDDPMDLGDSEAEEDAPSSRRRAGRPSTGGKAPARPKAKKEPRKAPKRKSVSAEEPRPKKRSKSSTKLEKDQLDSVDNDPEELRRRKARSRDMEEEVMDKSSGKRRRHSYTHPSEPPKKVRKIEAELASAKETISNLKKSLKKKEKALAELTGDGAGVACIIPPLPPPIEETLPGRDKYRSTPVDAKKFGNMMDTLHSDYESFKAAAEGADEARTELEKTMEAIKKLYHEASEKVSVAEEKATTKERDVVRNLGEILEADVQVQNLRERKAGHVVRAMLKKCKDLPAIHDFCDAIYKSWKTQVVEYMKENEGKLSQESPGAAKSSPGEKSERKSSESPTGSAKTTSKDDVKEEDTTASPRDKREKEPNKDCKDKDVEMKNIDAEGDNENEPEEDEPKKVKEENQKAPVNESNPKAERKDVNDKAEKKSSEKADKASSASADEKDAKSEEAKREEKPPKQEASHSVVLEKPDSSSKVDDRDRPPAKGGENK